MNLKKIIIFYVILTFITLIISSYLNILIGFFQHVDLVRDMFLGMSLAIPIVLISIVISNKSRIFKDLIGLFSKFFDKFSVFDVFLISMASGVSEELLFRGLIQHYCGIFITSIIFGVLHVGPNKKFLAWTLFAFLTGIYLGIARESLDSLIVPMVAHSCINFINIRWLCHYTLKTSSTSGNSSCKV